MKKFETLAVFCVLVLGCEPAPSSSGPDGSDIAAEAAAGGAEDGSETAPSPEVDPPTDLEEDPIEPGEICPPGAVFDDVQGQCVTEDGDACDPNPCRNGARCYEVPIEHVPEGYVCDCPRGFEGPRCETPIPPCDPNPCANGGLCTARGTDYECACPPGFEGRRCRVAVDPCADQPCRNGGVCQAEGADFVCDCADTGFVGARCEGVVCDGDFVVDTEAELADVSRCAEITGSLRVIGLDVPDLTLLRGLERVGTAACPTTGSPCPDGDFSIGNNSALVDLTGLENLVFIGGTLAVNANPQLVNLRGLDSLRQVANQFSGVVIRGNPRLESLAGLAGLETRRIGILRILQNPALTTLTGLDSLRQVAQNMIIEGNAGLADLRGLTGLEYVGRYFHIRQNPSLPASNGSKASV